MIKAAFIGTGGISSVHLKYLQGRRDVKIVALCDVNREQALVRQKEFGGEVFTDFNEMLEKAKPDAVWLCTPPLVRGAPLLACADRHVPVFCEKPVERDERRARKIAVALSNRRARVQVGYVFRCTPVVEVARKVIAADRIHLVHSLYTCGMSLKMSSRKWFYDKVLSGGALIDQATHNMDILRYLFGEVEEVRGTARNPVHKKRPGYTIEETIGLVMTFKNGIIGAHQHSWVGDGWHNEIIMSGEKNIYRLNLNTGIFTSDKPIEADCDIVAGRKKDKTADASFRFQQEKRSIYEYENAVFLKQVSSGDWRKNPSDYSDGLKTLRLTLACDRAVSGGVVRV